MDLRDLSPDISRVAQPNTKRSAGEFIERLLFHQRWIEHHRKPGEVTRIIYAGAFGVMQVLRISPQGDDFLSVVVKSSDGIQQQIVAPVSQCSFMFSTFTPAADEPPEERVLLGFAEGKAT